MCFYLGIDLGTTGVKAVLVAEDGKIASVGYARYPIYTPYPGYAEQNPDDWWKSVCEAIALAKSNGNIRAEQIRGVGFSGQMHGTVMLDKDRNILHPAIIHCDQRAYQEKQEILDLLPIDTLGRCVQNRVHSGFQATSLLWMRKNKSEIYDRIETVLLPKDYLRYKLTGQIGGEITDAGGTLLFDNIHKCWSREVLLALKIPEKILPKSDHLPQELGGEVSGKAAEETGLREGTLVAFGGADQSMQAVGNGIISSGSASINVGTSAQILVPTASPIYDSQLKTNTFCHALEHTWYVMGAVLNACLAINWFQEKVLKNDVDHVALHVLATKANPACDGLIFLPYLTGERSPHMYEKARGGFVGLTLKHNRADMVRAILEGVVYSLYDAMEVISTLEIPVDRYVLAGGGTKSPLWRQMIADMFGNIMYISGVSEQAGVGAAMCAMVATGKYSSLQQATARMVATNLEPVLPNPENTVIYREQFEVYKALYRGNLPIFETMSKLNNKKWEKERVK